MEMKSWTQCELLTTSSEPLLGFSESSFWTGTSLETRPYVVTTTSWYTISLPVFTCRSTSLFQWCTREAGQTTRVPLETTRLQSGGQELSREPALQLSGVSRLTFDLPRRLEPGEGRQRLLDGRSRRSLVSGGFHRHHHHVIILLVLVLVLVLLLLLGGRRGLGRTPGGRISLTTGGRNRLLSLVLLSLVLLSLVLLSLVLLSLVLRQHLPTASREPVLLLI
ncbi:hypothetical protein EYF80_028918 [Liparis tanakae]|uniref:Uncharacterized protein n=1 Tax=Liparis tanakae TaxID=230148 RepID=A0A4Z2H7D6_9TELE|nr:hypothetical protein EYF80_028918 [Liparis tanakae]